jgi:hypothetical protein
MWTTRPKYERDYKTGKYIIVNHWERAKINSNSKHRGFLPRLWSSEHSGNYMNFTGPLEFSIAPEYRSNEMLKSRVDEFREDIRDGIVTGDEYHKFFRSLSPYLGNRKTEFLELPSISVSIPDRLYVLEVFYVELYWKAERYCWYLQRIEWKLDQWNSVH